VSEPVAGDRAAAFQRGDRVVLLALDPDWEGASRFLLKVGDGASRVAGLGVVDTGRLVGAEPGIVLTLGSRRFAAVRPDLTDLSSLVRRKAQIILPKDAAQIVMGAAIGPGCRVAEAGVGTGALTIVLAWAVGPGGTVYSYDIREDHLEWGKGNVTRAGLAGRVRFSLADITQGIDAQGLDAVVLDMPEPWKALPAALAALAPGGRVAAYTPTVHQMEATVTGMRAAGLIDVEAMEVIVRPWHVVERSVRPAYDTLAHTAFLVFGRNVAR
jgi:tRNA (adenine57-N1/adenine58-N1)-methyltransferase catalytic subunit